MANPWLPNCMRLLRAGPPKEETRPRASRSKDLITQFFKVWGASTSKLAVILQSEHSDSENVMFARRGVVVVLFCPGASEFSWRLCLHSYYSTVYFIYSFALLDFNKVFSCWSNGWGDVHMCQCV